MKRFLNSPGWFLSAYELCSKQPSMIHFSERDALLRLVPRSQELRRRAFYSWLPIRVFWFLILDHSSLILLNPDPSQFLIWEIIFILSFWSLILYTYFSHLKPIKSLSRFLIPTKKQWRWRVERELKRWGNRTYNNDTDPLARFINRWANLGNLITSTIKPFPPSSCIRHLLKIRFWKPTKAWKCQIYHHHLTIHSSRAYLYSKNPNSV